MGKSLFDTWREKWPTLEEAKERIEKAIQKTQEKEEMVKKAKTVTTTATTAVKPSSVGDANLQALAELVGEAALEPDKPERNTPQGVKDLYDAVMEFIKTDVTPPITADAKTVQDNMILAEIEGVWDIANSKNNAWEYFTQRVVEEIDQIQEINITSGLQCSWNHLYRRLRQLAIEAGMSAVKV
jgi:hypothetical protein